ncbi:protein CURVATURE THYLAKOID 1D [Carex littledalei]|uniref:Protein CURVATURE THYLAKOID 1D n=1 Tax=Carex littledalei TaxID=544730 RepID=A0A833V2A0_9POAL|nr:protein CURVATURE THYLAKOID 1D [Carex littledalei]
MELAIAPRVLPSPPQSRLLIAKPKKTSSIRFRAKRGLVRSSSGSDFWSTVPSGEEDARVVVAEKEDVTPVEKEEEVKKEVSFEEEVKEEVPVDTEVKAVASSDEVSVDAEVKVVVSSEEVSEEQSSDGDLLDQLNLNFDPEDKSKLLVYGAGALVALWISSVVVSTIDSIPLFPQLMEVVGLGYTVWFTSRYLLFKDNREELFAKIVELKDQILGSDDE